VGGGIVGWLGGELYVTAPERALIRPLCRCTSRLGQCVSDRAVATRPTCT